jgi:hypothetical protein
MDRIAVLEKEVEILREEIRLWRLMYESAVERFRLSSPPVPEASAAPSREAMSPNKEKELS